MRGQKKTILIVLSAIIVASISLISYGKLKRHYAFLETQKRAKAELSDWIRNHALYPETYVPMGFSDFTYSETVEGFTTVRNSRAYKLKHVFKLKNKDNELVEFAGYFALDYEFDVTAIGSTEESCMGYYPPKTEIWTSQFGRPANKEDSLKLDAKGKVVAGELLRELKKVQGSDEMDSSKAATLNEALRFLDSASK